ncbi:MAG: hypothetical protein JWM88_2272 [Verrucomicrobia bacterium]|nr:hypothetical protein [Verrucomicrobiota bacterium]
MPLSTSSFERTIPDRPWPRLALVAASLALLAAIAWEARVRTWGYAPTLNDTSDLWAEQRGRVQPDSYVIIGDSRPHFDLDLDELERGLGQRPIQLALDGSCAYPVLADLAADGNFHGTVICSIVPGMFFAPGGPLIANSEKALKRYHHWTPAQRASHQLAMFAEEHLAFLKAEELDLPSLLARLPISNRAAVHLGPALPPYFNVIDRERRARMWEQAALAGPLQTRIKEGWIPLFTPPPPPSYLPQDVFLKGMGAAVEKRFHDTAAAVQKLRARGGRVVFVRFPNSGELRKHEDRLTPRIGAWTRLLNETKAPGIYFSDHPELAAFDCPEWSHLSAPDSVEFTKRLVPYITRALSTPAGG